MGISEEQYQEMLAKEMTWKRKEAERAARYRLVDVSQVGYPDVSARYFPPARAGSLPASALTTVEMDQLTAGTQNLAKRQQIKLAEANTATAPVQKKKPRITERKPPNKTEQRFFDLFILPRLMTKEYQWSKYNDVTLRIADGVRYTPDYVVMDKDGHLIAFEVKGPKLWDGAREKFLMARQMFPDVTFAAWQEIKRKWEMIWQ